VVAAHAFAKVCARNIFVSSLCNSTWTCFSSVELSAVFAIQVFNISGFDEVVDWLKDFCMSIEEVGRCKGGHELTLAQPYNQLGMKLRTWITFLTRSEAACEGGFANCETR
jgi:hypothetical protein